MLRHSVKTAINFNNQNTFFHFMIVCCKSVLHQEAIIFFFFRLPFNTALKVLSPWLNSRKCVSGGSVAHVFEAALMLSQDLSLFLAGFKGNKQTRPGWSGALGNYRLVFGPQELVVELYDGCCPWAACSRRVHPGLWRHDVLTAADGVTLPKCTL